MDLDMIQITVVDRYCRSKWSDHYLQSQVINAAQRDFSWALILFCLVFLSKCSSLLEKTRYCLQTNFKSSLEIDFGTSYSCINMKVSRANQCFVRKVKDNFM